MLKPIVVLFFMLSLGNAYADQRAILKSEDAKKTVAFLETQNEIVLFCGCCSSHSHQKLMLVEVVYDCESINWCEVTVKGTDMETGEEVVKRIDLAYTWINNGGVSKNLAWEMDLGADPCAPNFDWETFEPVLNNETITYSKKEVKSIGANLVKTKQIIESAPAFKATTFESKEDFMVNKVRVESDELGMNITIIHSGDQFEQRYTIPMNKVSELHVVDNILYVRAERDGTITIEEFKNGELTYRMFAFQESIPLIVSGDQLEESMLEIKNMHDVKKGVKN